MTKAIQNVMSEEQLALMRDSYPVEERAQRIILPRLGLYSQDVTEGKGKTMKVIAEAGTFYTEKQTDEVDENGKKIWTKTEIGTKFEGIILYRRYQLRHYNSAEESYTSSPIYDTKDEVVPLFRDKAEVDKGTPAELQSRKEYQGVSAKGKPISKLEENRILYVLYKDTLYQLSLRGTSMYAFLSYARTTLPPSVITRFSSESKTAGTIAWNQMTFEVVRPLDEKEGAEIMGKIQEIREAIQAEKAQYITPETTKADREFAEIGKKKDGAF